jgi:hypothetical protein
METQLIQRKGLRVAVEGCVSSLSQPIVNQILIDELIQDMERLMPYTRPLESLALNRWDSVDLLIIGGDFQVDQHVLRQAVCMTIWG